MITRLSRLFHKKRADVLTMELPKYNFSAKEETLTEDRQQPIVQKNERTERLMSLIEEAIEQWATEYNMERVPKQIIFEQALDVMQVIELRLRTQNTSVQNDYWGRTGDEHSNNYYSHNS